MTMYSTIKAEIEHGRIIPMEKGSLPASCQVLVTILTANGRMPQWNEVKKHLGFIRKTVDGRAWQKTIRSEWENRK